MTLRLLPTTFEGRFVTASSVTLSRKARLVGLRRRRGTLNAGLATPRTRVPVPVGALSRQPMSLPVLRYFVLSTSDCALQKRLTTDLRDPTGESPLRV